MHARRLKVRRLGRLEYSEAYRVQKETEAQVRDRLDQLEGRFRFEEGLRTQYQTLQGVSASAEQAAQQAAANRYDQAGRTLLEVANKLTDVLLEMQ